MTYAASPLNPHKGCMAHVVMVVRPGRGVAIFVTMIATPQRMANRIVARWLVRQPKTITATLTVDEWKHLADLFAGANDPISVSIGTKARAMIDQCHS